MWGPAPRPARSAVAWLARAAADTTLPSSLTTKLAELSPDEREYYASIALAVKRFSAYREFLDALKSEQEIKINQDYLYSEKNS